MQADDPVGPGIRIEPFDPDRHDRTAFPCGTNRLDIFLRLSAKKRQKDDFTRVFVAVAEGSPRILGYYALNTHAVPIDELGADRPPRSPNTGAIPALYLSMIAVDKRRQGRGLGADLAIDALNRARHVASEVGLKLVVLDVIDDGGPEAFARRRHNPPGSRTCSLRAATTSGPPARRPCEPARTDLSGLLLDARQ